MSISGQQMKQILYMQRYGQETTVIDDALREAMNEYGLS